MIRNSSIDEVLCEYLSRSPWHGDYDIVSGLVGFGVYALERLPRPTAGACLDLVVDHLDAMAERTDKGITWFTAPERLPDHQRKECPRRLLQPRPGARRAGRHRACLDACARLATSAFAPARQKARPLLDGAVALAARAGVGGSRTRLSVLEWARHFTEARPACVVLWGVGNRGGAASGRPGAQGADVGAGSSTDCAPRAESPGGAIGRRGLRSLPRCRGGGASVQSNVPSHGRRRAPRRGAVLVRPHA